MRTYIFALIVLGVVLLAHMAGLGGGLYYSIQSYDIFMHLLGGVGIGLFIAALLKSYKAARHFSRKNIIAGVIIIGIIWEIFEMYYGLTGYPVGTKSHIVDTIKDLIDDTIGGALVAYISC